MVSRSCFPLSLAVVLLLSSLASADSVPVNATFVHSSASAGVRMNPGIFAVNDSLTTKGQTTPTSLAAFNTPAPLENRNAHLSGLLLGNTGLGKDITNHGPGRFTFFGGTHGTIAHKNGDWATWHQGHATGLTAPEPGSLALLSTGLIGIAGKVRRKLRRS